jgi:hypothetical protein
MSWGGLQSVDNEGIKVQHGGALRKSRVFTPALLIASNPTDTADGKWLNDRLTNAISVRVSKTVWQAGRDV